MIFHSPPQLSTVIHSQGYSLQHILHATTTVVHCGVWGVCGGNNETSVRGSTLPQSFHS